jgi:hypothetical protein
LHVTVAVATAGRRETTSGLLAYLSRQERRPDLVAICPASPADIDTAACEGAGLPLRVITGPKGLTSQRNALLEALGDTDLIVFFDDDFVPAADYLRQCERVFEQHPDVVMLTGAVIADGILGPGLTPADAERCLAGDRPPARPGLTEVYNGYGCNMAVRASVVRATGLRFDETLPLYGWLEDVDFSRGLAAHGRIVNSDACRGVHMGVKRGRTSGVKLGYSQVANPLYLARKGRMTPRRALVQMARNIAQNCARAWRPEPWVDRRGRLQGNMRAFSDLVSGKLTPTEILNLP